MFAALVGLYHIFKFNLIINAILHGGLTFAIIKGFIIALIQWSLAHQSVAALLACSIFLATNGKCNNSKDLNGIFNYFQNKTSNHIEKEINFYSSSTYNIIADHEMLHYLTNKINFSYPKIFQTVGFYLILEITKFYQQITRSEQSAISTRFTVLDILKAGLLKALQIMKIGKLLMNN